MHVLQKFFIIISGWNSRWPHWAITFRFSASSHPESRFNRRRTGKLENITPVQSLISPRKWGTEQSSLTLNPVHENQKYRMLMSPTIAKKGFLCPQTSANRKYEKDAVTMRNLPKTSLIYVASWSMPVQFGESMMKRPETVWTGYR